MINSILFDDKKSFNKCYQFLYSLKHFTMFSEVIYVNSKLSKNELVDAIKGLVTYEERFYVEEITEKNLYRQPDIVRGWISEIWKNEKIAQEKAEFELANSQALEDYDKFLDFMESEYDKQMKQKESILE